MGISEKRKIGNLGEDRACKFLKKNDFKIIDRNYLKKWGEIDIIAQKKSFFPKKNQRIHFIEVKSVSCGDRWWNINGIMDNYLVSDNIHHWKLQRLSRVFQTYLMEKEISDEREWQFDIIIIFLNIKDKKFEVKYFEDIII
ncbi:MAG: YraN family protein [Candidatus Pacebacteria bacterium]|nr:YraN family protein [Candidatus Paceibacterota bacterium]